MPSTANKQIIHNKRLMPRVLLLFCDLTTSTVSTTLRHIPLCRPISMIAAAACNGVLSDCDGNRLMARYWPIGFFSTGRRDGDKQLIYRDKTYCFHTDYKLMHYFYMRTVRRTHPRNVSKRMEKFDTFLPKFTQICFVVFVCLSR